MSIALLLLPDFATILLGLGLKRWFESSKEVWSGIERLIYYALFPILLFTSNARAHIDLGAAAPMLIAGVGATVAGMLVGALARPLLKPDPRAFAAGFQCAFRFNTYIGLALISRLHGDAGVAGMSLLLGAVVPIANVAAVWSLAHRSGNVRREIARNPLIISTLSGIAFSLLGLSLPEAVWQMLARLGSVSLPLGLLAVGAALQLKGVGAQRALIAWFTAVKLLVVPATAYALALAFDLDILSLHIVILFGALPAATSAYILAERMGGDGKVVAAIISFSTLAAMLSLPLWLAAVGAGANAS